MIVRTAIVLIFGCQLWAQDALDIVRRSIERDQTNFEQLKNYTYQQRSEFREYDKNGRVKNTEVETHEILVLGGRQYERLISKKTSLCLKRKRARNRSGWIRNSPSGKRETESDKAKQEKERIEERKYLREFSEAFNFRLVGEESVSGQPAWMIEAEPKADYKAKSRIAKMFLKVRGKLWIDKSGYQWVKAEGEVTGTISLGLFLLRLAPGALMTFEQTRVNDEVWLPSKIHVRAEARLALIKKERAEIDIVYREYKKFQAESKLVAAEEKQ